MKPAARIARLIQAHLRVLRTVWLILLCALAPLAAPLSATEAAWMRLGSDLPWRMLIDAGGQLAVEQVATHPAFRSLHRHAAPGLHAGPIWLRFSVPQGWHQGKDLWLRVEPALLDSVRVYRALEGDNAGHWRESDNNEVMIHGGVDHDRGQLLFRLRPQERGDVLVRVQSLGPHVVTATLGPPEMFGAQRHRAADWSLDYAGAGLVVLALLLWGAYFLRRRAPHDPLVSGERSRLRMGDRRSQLPKDRRSLRPALNAEHRLLVEQRQFLAMICHEFRTPLTIVDQVATVQEHFPAQDEATQVERARQIRRATRRLNALVSNCLVDERLSAGGFVLRPQEVDVQTLVYAAAELVVLNAHQRVQTDIDWAPARWHADPTLLSVAISNLIDNAAKYSRRGCIRIMVAEIDSELTIAVSDDGPGIPLADRARIFQAFERVHRSEAGGGYGLGLYLTRRIAGLHGGDVTLTHSHFGGSVFHLCIPRSAQA